MDRPQAGTVVLGRYSLLRRIARGGMSSIWAAEDRRLERSVAVKLMASGLVEHEEARRRFEREAMAIARLQSPHIVQVFDYGMEGDAPVMVMELLHGEDLRRRLKKRRKLPFPKVVDIVRQCAKGLGEAHGAGIIHRDLKPGNIFFAQSRQQEVLKILDFGVAKADGGRFGTGNTTKAGEILGTPHFMSPEQARAKVPVDHRTDLWSLGVLTYRMLCGHLPFNGHNPTQVLIAAATEAFMAPTIYARDTPPEIDDWMNQALSREPDDRFQSAPEMASALEAIMAKAHRHLSTPAPAMRPAEDSSEALTVAERPPGTIEMPSPLLDDHTEDIVDVPGPAAGMPAPKARPPAETAPPPDGAFPSDPPWSETPGPSDPPLWPDPPDSSYPSAGSYPSQGSLAMGNVMLSAQPPVNSSSIRRFRIGVFAALVIGFLGVAGAITLGRHDPPEGPSAAAPGGEPMPGIPPAEPEPEPAASASADAEPEEPEEPEPEPTATASATAEVEAPPPEPVAAAPPTPKPAKPKPVYKKPPYKKPKYKPVPKKSKPDPYGSRF